MATILPFPRCSLLLARELRGIDLAHQLVKPGADRRNVVELWRVRLERDYPKLWELASRLSDRTGGGP